MFGANRCLVVIVVVSLHVVHGLQFLSVRLIYRLIFFVYWWPICWPTRCCLVVWSGLVVPQTRLKFGEREFSGATPRFWDELPSDVRKVSTLGTFKRHLKFVNIMAQF